jgi:hypothetical protein
MTTHPEQRLLSFQKVEALTLAFRDQGFWFLYNFAAAPCNLPIAYLLAKA